MHLFEYGNSQRNLPKKHSGQMLKLGSKLFALIVLALVLVGCSKQQQVNTTADSQLSIQAPGLERLRRTIDTTTLKARVVITSASDSQSIAATPTTPAASLEGIRTAIVQVPQDIPFSIEVIWSAMGLDSIRVDYAVFREAFPGTAQNISINVGTEQYDLSASAFDSDNDGISNFEELVAGTLATGGRPIAESAVAYYSLDFGQAIDSSGNNRNGTVIGGVSAADESGAIDSAIRLGNSMEHIAVPPGVVDGLRDFTIQFKVNFDAFNEGDFRYNTIFSIASLQDYAMVFAYGHNETAFPITERFYLASTGGGNIPSLVLFEQMNAIRQNSWHCVAVYRRGNAVGMVVDGVPTSSEIVFSTAVISADEGGFLIGQQHVGGIGGDLEPGKALAGIIDEFYIFDSALELADIQNICD